MLIYAMFYRLVWFIVLMLSVDVTQSTAFMEGSGEKKRISLKRVTKTDPRVLLLYEEGGCSIFEDGGSVLDEGDSSGGAFMTGQVANDRRSALQTLNIAIGRMNKYENSTESEEGEFAHGLQFKQESHMTSRFLKALKVEVVENFPADVRQEDVAKVAATLPCVAKAFIDENKYSGRQDELENSFKLVSPDTYKTSVSNYKRVLNPLDTHNFDLPFISHLAQKSAAAATTAKRHEMSILNSLGMSPLAMSTFDKSPLALSTFEKSPLAMSTFDKSTSSASTTSAASAASAASASTASGEPLLEKQWSILSSSEYGIDADAAWDMWLFPPSGDSTFDFGGDTQEHVNVGMDKNSVGMGTKSVGINTNSVGMGANYVGVNTNSVGMGTNSVGANTNSVGANTNSVGANTNSVGVNTNSVGMGTNSMGVNTNSVGIGTEIVAVIDSGCDINHEDLAGRMWRNEGEVCGDGIDNDGNGFIDDCYGWNFVDQNNNVNVDGSGNGYVSLGDTRTLSNGSVLSSSDAVNAAGHGTGASGIIAANYRNNYGISGICLNCKIMCLKFIGDGNGTISNQVQAIDYALTMGARISNNSYGGYGYSELELDVLNRAQKLGHLFVSSAGNHNLNTDLPVNDHTPSTYPLDNIIAVGASDRRGQKAVFSNYGRSSVDVLAPGVDIPTTFANNVFALAQGTSFAAPHVSAIAAFVWSSFPSLTYAEVKRSILGSCRPSTSQRRHAYHSYVSAADSCVCAGTVNAANALFEAANIAARAVRMRTTTTKESNTAEAVMLKQIKMSHDELEQIKMSHDESEIPRLSHDEEKTSNQLYDEKDNSNQLYNEKENSNQLYNGNKIAKLPHDKLEQKNKQIFIMQSSKQILGETETPKQLYIERARTAAGREQPLVNAVKQTLTEMRSRESFADIVTDSVLTLRSSNSANNINNDANMRDSDDAQSPLSVKDTNMRDSDDAQRPKPSSEAESKSEQRTYAGRLSHSAGLNIFDDISAIYDKYIP